MEKLRTLNEVADAWGVDYMTVWRWVQNSKLTAIRLPGGGLRVKDSEIQRILEEEREPVTA